MYIDNRQTWPEASIVPGSGVTISEVSTSSINEKLEEIIMV